MKKNNSKTDESVKAGLEIEAGHKKSNAKKLPVPHRDELTGEKDPDDIVHEQPAALPTDNVEQDLDEIVHEQGSITTAKEAEDELTEEEDMDELVHRNRGKL
jgi:hypothetical protein